MSAPAPLLGSPRLAPLDHGVVAWGTGVEDACFKRESVEAYCTTLQALAHLRKVPRRIPAAQLAELLAIERGPGSPDPRLAPARHSPRKAHPPHARRPPPRRDGGGGRP